jgi:Na+/H+ antiporter NhaA
MAATYSAFMTTRFYSPVFNTALFDGPFRIYFSQSYESSALKIYHLLQTQHQEVYDKLKKWSNDSKEHIFLLMYPEMKDVEIIFNETKKGVQIETWDEGVAIGMCQPVTDEEAHQQIEQIQKLLEEWMFEQKLHDITF